MDHWGIDYGSKLAGTTVICFQENEKICFEQSAKKQDADAFISAFIELKKPRQIFIDAPLSLPAAYFGKGEDYFYRVCDKETRAMSPMFLGGLTARAMKLRAKNGQVEFVETYPAYLTKHILGLEELYLKKEKLNRMVVEKIRKKYKLIFLTEPSNWHQFDALCCWISGLRNIRAEAQIIGQIDEGQIIV